MNNRAATEKYKPSDSISDIMVSCESHLICFAAEEARLSGTTVEMKEYIKKLGC